MRNEKIIEISAFLAPNTETKGNQRTRLLEKLVNSVYLNRKALTGGILSCHVNSNRFAVITLDLNKCRKKLRKSLGLDSLLDGTLPIRRCSYCGCYYFTYLPYQYRDNCGCIGRSYECISCRQLYGESLYTISEAYKENGVRAARDYLEKIYTNQKGKTICRKCSLIWE